MKLFFKTSSNPEVEYNISVGSTITDTFNEELDSASLIIPQVQEVNRLVNIKPYDECKIYNEDESFVRYYLVNSFKEKEINLKKHIYEYAIDLMSETKYLEKIQLPNRQFLHTQYYQDGELIYFNQKYIYEVIEELMDLYIPKIKYTSDGKTWNYTPFITYNDEELKERFSIKLKDCSMSQPTLRQALTSIMMQVGCIPKIEHRVLKWLDFNSSPNTFEINDGINYIEITNSSSSYVNTLINQGDNILDLDNVVCDEVLTFRDFDNVSLQQTKNLYLNTQYNIYNVEYLGMARCGLAECEIVSTIGNAKSLLYVNVNGYNAYLSIVFGKTSSNTWDKTLTLTLLYEGSSITLNDIVIKYISLSNNHINFIEDFIELGDLSLSDFTYSGGNWIYSLSVPDDFDSDYITLMTLKINGTPYYNLSGFDEDTQEIDIKYIPCTSDYVDITSLCLESSKRAYLDRDYTKITKDMTLAELAKTYYGTIEYQIGSNKISGFSNFYYNITFFGQEGNTWFDVISTKIQDTLTCENSEMFRTALEKVVGIDYEYLSIKNATYSYQYENIEGTFWATMFDSSIVKMFTDNQIRNNSAIWIFKIKYNALNSLSSRYSKNKDIPLKLEQLDTSTSSITNFEDFDIHEKESINRIGENALYINERNTYYQGDNFNTYLKYNNYEIFKRVVSVGINNFLTNYIGSENAIIKNYSTAIQTKYRAYSYVNYNEAIERKENETFYIYITKDYSYNGDIKLYFNNIKLTDFINPNKDTPLLYGFTYDYKRNSNTYINNSNGFKNQMQILTSENKLIFGQKEFMNSQGACIIQSSDLVNATLDGGVLQTFVSYSVDYYTKHFVGFTTSNYFTEKYLNEWWDYILTNPGLIGFQNNLLNIDLVNGKFFCLCDDNTTTKSLDYESFEDEGTILSINDFRKTYYKDWSELINQSLQFEYVIDDDITLCDDYLKYIRLLNNTNKNITYLRNCNLAVGKEVDEYLKARGIEDSSAISFESNYILATYNKLFKTITIVAYDTYDEDTDMLKNVKVLGKISNLTKNTKYYVIINDTKTHQVYSDVNGLLSLNYTLSKDGESLIEN